MWPRWPRASRRVRLRQPGGEFVPIWLASRWKPFKWVNDGNIHCGEMALVARQYGQAVATRGCRNGNIGKPGSMATAAARKTTGSGDLGYRGIERQHAIAIKVQHRFQPIRELSGFPFCTLTASFGNAVSDLRDRDGGQK